MSKREQIARAIDPNGMLIPYNLEIADRILKTLDATN